MGFFEIFFAQKKFFSAFLSEIQKKYLERKRKFVSFVAL